MNEQEQTRKISNNIYTPILKLIIFGVSVFAASLLAVALFYPIYMLLGIQKYLTDPLNAPVSVLLAAQIPPALTTIVLSLIFVRYIDKRPMVTIGIERRGSWLTELLFGILLGFMFPALMFIIAYLAGWIKINGSLFDYNASRIFSSISALVILMILIAVSEEFASRGYIFQTLNRGYGPVIAILISSTIFGVLHIANPGSSLNGVVGVFLAGLMLGYGYFITKRLWLPMGFHFAWNFALGPIFGFPVSGISKLDSWIQQIPTASKPLWTGGDFGPEAGLFGYLSMLIAIILIWVFSKTFYHAGNIISAGSITDGQQDGPEEIESQNQS